MRVMSKCGWPLLSPDGACAGRGAQGRGAQRGGEARMGSPRKGVVRARLFFFARRISNHLIEQLLPRAFDVQVVLGQEKLHDPSQITLRRRR